MTDYIKVEESYVDALIKNAAWDAVRVEVLTEGDKKGDKSKDKPGDEADFETGARKGDKSNDPKKKGDKPDFTTGARKGDKSKTHPGKDFEKGEDDDDDEMKESVEAHTCPLCESTLDEEISDEQIYEHVAQIQAALQSIEEGGDEDDVEPTDDDLDAIEAEPDMDEKKKKKSKKESVMKKVKELKKSAKGK